MEIYVINNTPYLDHTLIEPITNSFKKYFPGAYDVCFGEEHFPNKYYRWNVIIRVEIEGYVKIRIYDRCNKYNIMRTERVINGSFLNDMITISHLLDTILKEFRDYYETLTEPTYRYCKYDMEAVNQAVEVYNNKKTISECAESIINKCGGDEKYSINLCLRISLVPYCEDKEYIDSLIAKFTNVHRNIQMIDKLERALHKRGWCAEIHYDKHPLKCLKRIAVNEFYIKVYDNYCNMKHRITQDVTCDVSDSIDLLLRKTIEYLNKENADIEAAKNKRAIEAINNIYGYKKEENNMAYFNYNNYDRIEQSQAVKDQSRHRMIQSMEMLLRIRDVKFNDPATIVFWDDGTKTVVKCQKGDKFDPEKGLAMAIVKKQCGRNEGYFNKIFQKWCPDEDIDIPKSTKESKRPTVFTETAEEYNEEVKKLKKIGDGYDDIRWEKNGRIVRK